MFFKWIFVLLSTTLLFSSVHQETIDGTHITVQKERRDDYFALVIRGTGMYTFVHELGSKEENYQINSLQVMNQQFVIEGYYLEHATRTYHAYVLVLSKEGDILMHKDFYDPSHQDISGIYPLKEGYLIHLSQMDASTEIFEKDFLIVLKEDEITTEYDREIMAIQPTEEGYHLTFKYDSSPSVFITLDGEFLAGNQVIGVRNQESYSGDVTLLFAGEATLNQTTIQAPYTVYSPGHYTLIVDKTYTRFTLNPQVTGVTAHTVYTQPVHIAYDLGQAFLNNEPYASNETIDKPGQYVFGMYMDDYIYEIPFTITANVKGIKHLESYENPVSMQFMGEGYLNNQLIQSGYSVSEPGRYTLKVFGANQYLETHTFEIVDSNANRFNIEWVEMGLLGGSVVLGTGMTLDLIIRKLRKKQP